MREIYPIKEIDPKLLLPEIHVKDNEKGFMDLLTTAVKKVNQANQVADKASEQVVKGELGIHEGMLRIHEADVSLKLLLQVRSKVLEAYREIIHMAM